MSETPRVTTNQESPQASDQLELINEQGHINPDAVAAEATNDTEAHDVRKSAEYWDDQITAVNENKQLSKAYRDSLIAKIKKERAEYIASEVDGTEGTAETDPRKEIDAKLGNLEAALAAEGIPMEEAVKDPELFNEVLKSALGEKVFATLGDNTKERLRTEKDLNKIIEDMRTKGHGSIINDDEAFVKRFTDIFAKAEIAAQAKALEAGTTGGETVAGMPSDAADYDYDELESQSGVTSQNEFTMNWRRRQIVRMGIPAAALGRMSARLFKRYELSEKNSKRRLDDESEEEYYNRMKAHAKTTAAIGALALLGGAAGAAGALGAGLGTVWGLKGASLAGSIGHGVWQARRKDPAGPNMLAGAAGGAGALALGFAGSEIANHHVAGIGSHTNPEKENRDSGDDGRKDAETPNDPDKDILKQYNNSDSSFYDYAHKQFRGDFGPSLQASPNDGNMPAGFEDWMSRNKHEPNGLANLVSGLQLDGHGDTMADRNSLADLYDNNRDAHHNADVMVQEALRDPNQFSMKIIDLDSYNSTLMVDNNGDPIISVKNGLNLGGQAIEITNKKTGLVTYWRIDCGGYQQVWPIEHAAPAQPVDQAAPVAKPVYHAPVQSPAPAPRPAPVPVPEIPTPETIPEPPLPPEAITPPNPPEPYVKGPGHNNQFVQEANSGDPKTPDKVVTEILNSLRPNTGNAGKKPIIDNFTQPAPVDRPSGVSSQNTAPNLNTNGATSAGEAGNTANGSLSGRP